MMTVENWRNNHMEEREIRTGINHRAQKRIEKNMNLDYLRELSGGDKAFMLEIMEMFVNDAPNMVQQIQGHFKLENLEMYKITVHKLKSSVKMLGHSTLAALLQEIEDQAMDENARGTLAQLNTRMYTGINMLVEEAREEIKVLS